MKQQISIAVALLIASSSAIKTEEGAVASIHRIDDVTAVQIDNKTKTDEKSKAGEDSSSDSDSSDSSDSDSDVEEKDKKLEKKESKNAEKTEQKKPEDKKKEEKKPEEKKKEDKPKDKTHLMWQVTPDLGELDDHSTLIREWDNPEYLSAMKPKFSGWTNPLSWTDGGDDDDQVLILMTQNGIVQRRIPESLLIAYEESEGPTKVDFGDSDMHVLGRDRDGPEYLEKMGPKFHGWTNPLSWTDGGEDDEKVI